MRDQTKTPLLFTYNYNQTKESTPAQYKVTAIDIAPASFGVRVWPTGGRGVPVWPIDPNTAPAERPPDDDALPPLTLSWKKFKEFNMLQQIKIIDFIVLALSSFSSFGCLAVAGFFLLLDKHPAYAKITREILLYSQEPTFVLHQRFMQQGYDNACQAYTPQYLQPDWKKNDVKMTWEEDEDFEGVASVTTVFTKGRVNLWWVLIFIYLFAASFQCMRCIHYRLNMYKIEKGPDFSRWLEYFCTSPLQILVVYLAFGFGNLDVLLGAMGMQAALVLFGYDIEQQIKKKIKRRVSKEQNLQLGRMDFARYQEENPEPDPARKGIFHHQFPIFYDIRIVVYLLFAWILHTLIWGIPNLESNANWGLGGRLAVQKLYSGKCHDNEHDRDFKIPEIVDIIFWTQYLCFTVFGIVSTSQVIYVWRRQVQFTQEVADLCWARVSLAYTALSVTAKVALEVGFLFLAVRWRSWEELPVLPSCDGALAFTEGQCIWQGNFTAQQIHDPGI